MDRVLPSEQRCIAFHTDGDKRWQLVRDVTGLEKRIGRKLTNAELVQVFSEWYRLSKQFLDPAKTLDGYFQIFLAELTKVRVPTGEGETNKKALESTARLVIFELPVIPDYPDAPESWRRVAAVHRELARSCRGNAYFLSCRHGAKAHSGMSYQAVSDINHTLERLGVIKLVRAGDQRPNGKASEFRYMLAPADTGLDEDDRKVEINEMAAGS